MEIIMLRWEGGVTRLDNVRNEYIRCSFIVAPITDKMTEDGMNMPKKRDENHMVQIVLNLPEQKRSKDCLPMTWWSNIKRHLEQVQLPAESITQNRTTRSGKVRRPDLK
ncbi:hypothetical protein EVAR_27220_1 [Eumeta japonica]|uniref:Uncharacterized protein n=1 Tax=Eumeta variegata TaxID=151549 RepID=A0A4C1VYF6_EUMVA|nr:hypothetical protein EVAR_27220_1 [Eumeta japonica]